MKKYIMKTNETEQKKVIDDLILSCRKKRSCTECVLLIFYDIDILECPFNDKKASFEE